MKRKPGKRLPAPGAGASPPRHFWSLGGAIRALRHGLRGLRDTWTHEAAFKQEVALSVVLTPAAFLIGQGWLESAILLLSLAQLLVVELINTAIEAAIDRIGPEYHELSRMAKDAGAAAVLVSVVLVLTVWAMALHHWWGAPR